MTPRHNIEHKFDLTGLTAGQRFVGCTKCWWQLPPGAACAPWCPKCDNRLSILDVTTQDIQLALSMGFKIVDGKLVRRYPIDPAAWTGIYGSCES